MHIPYFRPDISDAEISSVLEVLKTGWVSTGPKTAEFEDLFSKFLGLESATNANAVSSATAGLHLALEALGADSECEVFLPTMTFTATAEVCSYVQAKVRLIDSSIEHPNIDLNDLIYQINSSKAKKIFVIPVHFGGTAVDVSQIRNRVEKDVFIIEDAAHAFPSRIDNRLVGTLESDASVFSFYANKTITTGEGGMVVASDEKISARIRMMKSHGIDRNAFDRFQGNRNRSWEYDVLAAGYKYNLSDVLSAIGTVQLAKAEDMNKKRVKIAETYNEYFKGLPLRTLQSENNKFESSWHIYSIDLEEDCRKDRDEVMHALSLLGIQTSLHYRPIHDMTYWKKLLNLDTSNFPNANKRYRNTISLPIFPGMSQEEVGYVATAVISIIS
jgi:dTDP-4-amino-4,6-dideoxygalactose transaminase